MNLEIPPTVLDVIRQKYNICDHLSFLDFDFNFDVLKSRLSQLSKSPFNDNDRIVIEHMDTDYYFSECSVGVNLRNFFGVVRELDISYSRFIFYTNHFGLIREIDQLCSHSDSQDRPLIIESFLSELHYKSDCINPVECNFDRVQFHATCMMVLKRSHRNAMYNAIKDIDQSKLMLAINSR
jgi:hypothetical protein